MGEGVLTLMLGQFIVNVDPSALQRLVLDSNESASPSLFSF
jgi:hypothetical protein